MGLLDTEVTHRVNATVQGGNRPVGVVSTLQGGDRPVAVDMGLDDVNLDVGGTGTPLHGVAELQVTEPVRTDSDLRVAVTEPVVSEVDTHLDVEPVQVDLCVDVGLTRLPRACIHQPYTSRIGVTLLGIELVGLRWSGESSTIIDDLEERPHHELGDVVARPGDGHARPPIPHRAGRSRVGPDAGGGLHVRLA